MNISCGNYEAYSQRTTSSSLARIGKALAMVMTRIAIICIFLPFNILIRVLWWWWWCDMTWWKFHILWDRGNNDNNYISPECVLPCIWRRCPAMSVVAVYWQSVELDGDHWSTNYCVWRRCTLTGQVIVISSCKCPKVPQCDSASNDSTVYYEIVHQI